MSAARTMVAAAAALACGAAVARADVRVENPRLAAPERGSLAGAYGGTAFAPEDVARGGFSLPSPLRAPAERGELAAPVFPAYSPDAGLSEWGIGWSARLTLERYRVRGEPRGDTSDDLTGPWGRMVRGDDGAFYPAGMQQPVRVIEVGGGLVAIMADGSRWSFGEMAAARLDRDDGAVQAWYLTSIVTLDGARTRLTWAANASGRPFLQRVEWGGRGDDTQARLDFDYEAVPLALVSWRTGRPVELERRVRAVRASTRHAWLGSWHERWRHELGYQAEAWGPAWYLTEVRTVYASGESAPVVRYGYAFASDHLLAAEAVRVPEADAVLAVAGDGAFAAERGAALDVDRDGRLDVELADELTLLRRTDSGYAVEAAPPAPGDADPGCRPEPAPWNPPRLLAPVLGDDEPRVVTMMPDAWMIFTDITVCSRDGRRLGATWLDGNYGEGALTRIVDVDGDRRPEMVRLDIGEVHVAQNLSQEGQAMYGWDEVTWLEPVFVPHQVWVQEMNGDGMPDLVAHDGGSLVVWPGIGRRRFATQGTVLDLRTDDGLTLSGLDQYSVQLVDANKDGLTDALVSGAGSHALFVNNGWLLVQTEVPALAEIDWQAGVPSLVDVTGSGGSELAWSVDGAAWALPLDAPGAGLLASVDDGAGNVVRFDYARAAAEPGARRRQVVLANMSVESTGLDRADYSYDYAGATVHGDGAFLIGFAEVTRHDPRLTHRVAFINDDDAGSAPVEITQEDPLVPGAAKIERREHDLVSFRGVPWLRLARTVSGFARDGAEALQETVIDEWAGICPVRLRTSAGGDTLTREITLAAPSGLVGALACLPARAVERGAHTDAALDFVHEELVSYDTAGRVTQVASASGGETLVGTQIGYNADGTIAWVAEPGMGVTSYGWQARTLQLERIDEPTGVATIASYRPESGLLAGLRVERGALAHEQGFAYDGQERLARAWDDATGTSETMPLVQIDYAFAGAAHVATRHVRELVDPTRGVARESLELFAADGTALGALRRGPAGWEVHGLQRPRIDGSVERYQRDPLDGALGAGAIAPAALWNGATLVSLSRQSPLGVEGESRTVLHAGVEQRVRISVAVDGGRLRRDAVENDAFVTHDWVDAAGRVVARADESGRVTHFRLDARGRLREVRLADGTRHTVAYDGFGRRAGVWRQGIGARAIAYLAGTDLPASESLLDAGGAVSATTSFVYDGAGRVIERRHVGAGGDERRFDFTYDEDGQLGMLTGVAGDGFERRFAYRGDGKLVERRTRLGDWREVVSVFDYFADGSVAVKDVDVLAGAGGALLERQAWGFEVDGFGRQGKVWLGGAPLATLAYDDTSRLAQATLAGGGRVRWSYDPVSKLPVGMAQDGPFGHAATSLRRDSRGRTVEETLSIGPLTRTRGFAWSAEGWLAGVSGDPADFAAFTYGATGLPARIAERGDDLDVTDMAAAGHGFDALGRTVRIDDLELVYGPDQQIAEARRGGESWQFVHDEAGQRLLKLGAGGPERGYLEEGVLEAGGLSTQVQIGGTVVGVVRGGGLVPLPMDSRGTRLGDATGAPDLASPFGRRDGAGDPVVDFVQSGFDEDLRLHRMGVRDYDPVTHRFVQPDPLFLAQPEKCVESPTECNLYGYARANPLDNWDPSGMEFEKVKNPGSGAWMYGEAPVIDGKRSLFMLYDADNDLWAPAYESPSGYMKPYETATPSRDPQRFDRWQLPDPQDLGEGVAVGGSVTAGVGIGLRVWIGQKGMNVCFSVGAGAGFSLAFGTEHKHSAPGFGYYVQHGASAQVLGFGGMAGGRLQLKLDGAGQFAKLDAKPMLRLQTPGMSVDLTGRSATFSNPGKVLGQSYTTKVGISTSAGSCATFHYDRGMR